MTVPYDVGALRTCTKSFASSKLVSSWSDKPYHFIRYSIKLHSVCQMGVTNPGTRPHPWLMFVPVMPGLQDLCFDSVQHHMERLEGMWLGRMRGVEIELLLGSWDDR